MEFYHGTSLKNWKKIQEDGILLGQRFVGKREISPCTYLAIDLEEARMYGPVVLSVKYDPLKNPKENNYTDDCWQFRVYEPIPIENIQVVELNY